MFEVITLSPEDSLSIRYRVNLDGAEKNIKKQHLSLSIILVRQKNFHKGYIFFSLYHFQYYEMALSNISIC